MINIQKIITALVLSSGGLFAQTPTISPQVLNSAGDHRQIGTSGVYITDNVGEPFTETIRNNFAMITQGFLQPEVVSIGGFTFAPLSQSISCLDKVSDAFISMQVTSISGSSYTATYLWTGPNQTNPCPTNNCSKIDTLKPGIYSVTIAISYVNSVGVTKYDTLYPTPIDIAMSSIACEVIPFKGVTANFDGINDVFTIENIQEFPNNTVTIYNRWGKEMAMLKGYNNTTVNWPAPGLLESLVASTYFYVIDLGNGGKPIKGWVELMKD